MTFSGTTTLDVAEFVANHLITEEWKDRFRKIANEGMTTDLPRDTANGFALQGVLFDMGVPEEFTLSISSLQDYFQWKAIARVTNFDLMVSRLIDLFEICGWEKDEVVVEPVAPEDFEDNFHFDSSMGETLIVDCDMGDADISFRDTLQFHEERGEELGYTPNVDPGSIRVAIAGGDSEILNRLCVDVDNDYIFFSYFLGGGLKSRDEINQAIDSQWGRIGHILNQLDPGTFGSTYLFDQDSMRLDPATP